jgi:hypothetical protein
VPGYDIRGGETVKWLLGGGKTGSGKDGKGGTGVGIPLVGAGVATLWHEWQMVRIGRGVDADLGMGWVEGLVREGIWYSMLGGGPLRWLASG